MSDITNSLDLSDRPVRRDLAGRWERYRAERFPAARRRLPWVVAAGLVVYIFSQYLSIGWVTTESVPAHVVLVLKGTAPRPGQLMAYAYAGQEIAGYRRGDVFIKYAAAFAGDTVHREGRRFWAETARGRIDLGIAKQVSRKGLALQAAEAGVVPPGFVYAWGPHVDALDSRYAAAGLVRRDAVVGRAVALF